MLAEERFALILDLLTEKRTATVQELCEALNASESTIRRARQIWFLTDDSKFGRIYPAVISALGDAAILTNRCPDPKYGQLTLVKETER